jgi:glycosyltransferase involved in cell wall biosynthesis
VKISVVVPAFNEEKLLGPTLQSIQAASRAFSERGWNFELIVCDNNSTDRTRELAEAQGATVVFEPINQISRARNTGASAATGDWLIFVDADSKPSLALFHDVALAIESGKALAGGALVKMDRGGLGLWLVTKLWTLLSVTLRWCAGSFIFCDASAFREIGGFNLNLYAGEELDLSARLKRLARARGKKVIILRRHPLLTSARKMSLYSVGDHLRMLCKTLLSPKRTLSNREECALWYDGRR